MSDSSYAAQTASKASIVGWDRSDSRDAALSSSALGVVYAMFALSGAAALIYEVLWMRDFRLVFGSSSQSAAVVLAAFFAGMALGNMLGARLANRPNLLRVYGWLEIAVGLSALLVSAWLALYRAVYPIGYDWLRSAPALLSMVKLILAFLAVFPPAVAMGATLPVLSRAVVDRPHRLASRTGRLYALNVLGAVVGALLAGFYLPMAVGVKGALYIAVVINLLVGIAAVFLSGRWQPLTIDGSPIHPHHVSLRRPSLLLLAVAAVSGFGSLALEVIYVRILVQQSDGSVYAFAMMLAIFLLCLAGGAWVVSRWLDRWAPWRFLAWTQLAAIIAILLSTALFHFHPFLAVISASDTYALRTLKFAVTSLLLLAPPVLLIGTVLPWTWKVASRAADDVGNSVGVLTAVNTVAAVCGSLLAGFAFLPWLGLGGSALLVAALYSGLAVVGFWQASSGLHRWLGITACVLIPALWYVGGLWQPVYQPLGRGEKLLSYRDTADGTVAVIEHAGGHRWLKLNHEYTLASSAGAEREMGQGRLPLMLHSDPRRVAFIGAATGITCSAALEFPVQRLVAIELLPGVADTLPMFKRWNGEFYNDPRVELVVDDGRNYLLGARDEFDVIVSDLFVPWHAGTGDLYTVENFQTARRRLAPGGIFAQWLPGYQLTVDELRTICASFLAVFPNSTMWRIDFQAQYPTICLVGHRDELEVSPRHIADSRTRIAESKVLKDTYLSSRGGLEMLFVCGDAQLRDWSRGAVLNSDEHPVIEYMTPISFWQHWQQKHVASVQECMASFRPRVWPYPQQPTEGLPVERALRAADLLQDAILVGAKNDVEGEFELLLALEEYVDELPVVALHMTRAAARYRTRHMTERGEQLLAAVVRHAGAPEETLVALATVRKQAGDEEQAIALLERVVDGSPENAATRKQLIELLTKQQKFDHVERHLLELLDDAPNDPYLRLDLARALDRQGNESAAREQLDEFRARWDGTNGPAVWRYLRSLGLGKYIDGGAVPPRNAAQDAASTP